MKIGINATILGDKPTGLGIYTINIINELVTQAYGEGHEVVIYTSHKKPFTNSKAEVREVSKYTSPKYGKLAGMFRFIWNQVMLPFYSTKDKVDIIYSTTHHGSFFGKDSQILTIHDTLPLIFPKQHKLQNYYFKYIIPLLLRKTKGLVTVSNSTKDDLVKNFNYSNSNIDIVYNSYNKDHFKYDVDEKYKNEYGRYFLFVGASYPHKNLDRALEALKELYENEDFKDVKILITGGRKDYTDIIIEKFQKYSFFENVVLLDYVPFNELPKLYSNAIALVYPSLYEGFGIPPIEAMACMCPTIVSNKSSLPEVCGDASLYINPEDKNDIYKAMKKMLVDKKLRGELIERGLLNCERFQWDKSASELLKLLNEKGGEAG